MLPARPIETSVCIAGGGPAGLMLGFLLARAGVPVVVLEKHADFLRDFRGDTIHPSTLELMYELGLLDRFLRLPHQKVATLTAQFGDSRFTLADLSRLPTRCKFIAFMPQWDFLDFLADNGRRYPAFSLHMNAAVTGLIEEGGRIVGVSATTPQGPIEVRPRLTVGADGRHSTVREAAGLQVRELGAPMDAMWFRLPRQPSDPAETMGRFDVGRIFVLLNRDDYWQCAWVIPKDGFKQVQAAGLDAFRAGIAAGAPFLAERTAAIASWDDVRLLTVRVDRLERWWRPGLLCIGDAAHAMSPVGGVGINLAIQDAVAAANILAAPLALGSLEDSHLAAVEKRRLWPTRVTQRLQVAVQNNVIAPTLGRDAGALPIPLLVRLLAAIPLMRRLPARLVGIGIRPEHIQTPDVGAATGT